MYSHSISYLGICSTEEESEDQIHIICRLSYANNTMSADALVTLGTKGINRHVCPPKLEYSVSNIRRVNKATGHGAMNIYMVSLCRPVHDFKYFQALPFGLFEFEEL